ncbi:MAG: hypothetical protein AAGK00_15040 [Pseudomonadota bacterium]
MAITVKKDPTRRLGGWALIGFQGEAPAAVSVSIERDEGSLYLGPHGWQGAPFTYDSYTVEVGPQGPFIRVGPEIVNHLEPYLPITIRLPEVWQSELLSWPEEVIPSPDAFEGGGVHGDAALMPAAPHMREDRGPEPDPPVRPPEPPPQEPPAAKPTAVKPTVLKPAVATPTATKPPVQPTPTPAPPPTSRGGPWLWAVLVVLLLAGIGAASYVYWAEIIDTIDEVWAEITGPDILDEPDPVDPETAGSTDPPPDQPIDPVAPAPPPEPVDVADLGPPACDSLNATTPQEADRLREVMMLCRQSGEIEIEIEALDRLPPSADNDLRWGEIYDPSRTEPGRPFGLNPDSALRAYNKAQRAGSQGAQAAIDQLCAWLEAEGGVSNDAIRARHCQ